MNLNTTEELEAIYAANDTFWTKGEKAADYRKFLELLGSAKPVTAADLARANTKFTSYPSAAHFRNMTALMLVYQHQH